MVNTRQKGNRNERKCEALLKEKGFSTSRMPHTRYGPSDHFSLFDIIAMKPDAPIKMIQVKSNTPPNLAEFKEECLEVAPLKHAEIEIWTHFDREGFQIRRLKDDEWQTLVDERDNGMKIGEEVKKEYF